MTEGVWLTTWAAVLNLLPWLNLQYLLLIWGQHNRCKHKIDISKRPGSQPSWQYLLSHSLHHSPFYRYGSCTLSILFLITMQLFRSMSIHPWELIKKQSFPLAWRTLFVSSCAHIWKRAWGRKTLLSASTHLTAWHWRIRHQEGRENIWSDIVTPSRNLREAVIHLVVSNTEYDYDNSDKLPEGTSAGDAIKQITVVFFVWSSLCCFSPDFVL